MAPVCGLSRARNGSIGPHAEKAPKIACTFSDAQNGRAPTCLRAERDRLKTTNASLEDLVATKETALGSRAVIARLERNLGEANKKLARIPELEQSLRATRERADASLREVSA